MKDRATLDLFETDSQDDMRLPAGIDEAGRGPLAGPVYAAAVILNPLNPIEGLKDSKKLTPAEREALAPIIQERALAWSVAFATVEEIDSMRPTILLIDGNRMPHMPYRIRTIIKGDDRVPEISAASILAKTAHDALFKRYAKEYPGYGFEHHMGYGTAEHMAAIERLGVLPIHRKTFEPIASRLAKVKKSSVSG